MATLRDVARVAGVSLATASRALAQPERVTSERRTRVERAAAELGYRPPNGRSLAGPGPGRTIGLLLPDLENPFFAGVAKGVQFQARAAGLCVIIADTDEDPRLEAETLARLDQHVAGLILCSPRMSDQALAALPIDVPAVLVNRESAPIRSVVVDNIDGIRQGLAHLHALGHRTIAYAGGQPHSWSDRERRHGLQLAAAELGDITLIDLGHFPTTFGGGVSAADLIPPTGATAVIAHNDLIALGILDQLRQRGTRIPEQISIVGFDDIPAATHTTPALTTISIPLQRLGRAAVELLLDEDTEADNRTMPVSLTVRSTTTPHA